MDLRPVGSLAEAAREAALVAALVANCAGIGARDLVPDPLVRPVRPAGHIIENPGLDLTRSS
jgi:D-amino-acid oxidase